MSQDKNSTGGVNDFQSTVSAVGVVVVIVANLRRGRRRRIHFQQRMERSGEPFQVSEDELGQVVAVAAFEEV